VRSACLRVCACDLTLGAGWQGVLMAGSLLKRGQDNTSIFRTRHMVFTRHELSYSRVEGDPPVGRGEYSPIHGQLCPAAATRPRVDIVRHGGETADDLTCRQR
jgi:hypothetical protein